MERRHSHSQAKQRNSFYFLLVSSLFLLPKVYSFSFLHPWFRSSPSTRLSRFTEDYERSRSSFLGDEYRRLQYFFENQNENIISFSSKQEVGALHNDKKEKKIIIMKDKQPLTADSVSHPFEDLYHSFHHEPSVPNSEANIGEISKPNILSLSIEDFVEEIGGRGRAKMIWKSYKEGYDPFENDIDSPLYDDRITEKTRTLMKQNFQRPQEDIIENIVDSDCGTRKLVIQLADKLKIEAVLIPTKSRTTVCISSQVGCSRGCIFCLTGTMGLVRNLESHEILIQFVYALQQANLHSLPRVRNIVFMGMGEPLNNPRNVKRSLHTLTSDQGFQISSEHITVSTVGPSPQAIHSLVDFPAKLAWSIHAATDTTRKLLVPSSRHKMEMLRDAFLDLLQKRRIRYESLKLLGLEKEVYLSASSSDTLFVELTMLEGINDSIDYAEALYQLLLPLGQDKVKVNLIPYNEAGGKINTKPKLIPSPIKNLEIFKDYMISKGFLTTYRTPRGSDNSMACGQLVTQNKKENL